MPEDQTPLEDAIGAIEEVASGGETQVGDLLDAFEDRSLGFILVLFGLLVSLPVIGAVPGLPAIAAVVILLTILHSFLGGERHFWAPGALREKRLDPARVRRVLERIRPYARRVDALLTNRLGLLVDSRGARAAIALICAMLALAFFILSLVPFLVLPASIAVMIFGLALMSRDGLLALIGYGFTAGSLYAVIYAARAVL